MSVLEVIQRAAPLVGVAQPSAVFSADDAMSIEIGIVAQEAAERIVRAHDWTALIREESYAGDGTTTDFDLPSDYLRMTRGGKVWSTSQQQPLSAVPSSEDWLNLDVRNFGILTGAWIILRGDMLFTPAPADGDTIRWNYITKEFITDADGTAKARFTADTDVFGLDERLLELGFIWVWRQRKGLTYAEDLTTFEIAMAQAISDDKGARVITQRSRRTFDARLAYPWSIEP